MMRTVRIPFSSQRPWRLKRGDDAALIVAFLQNAWYPPEHIPSITRIYAKRGKSLDGRAELNARFLFCRPVTGRRLREAFGEELCDQIAWHEISPQFGTKSSDVFPPDLNHVGAVLAHHKPKVVLALGKVAAEGLEDGRMFWDGLVPEFELVTGPHPAGRGADVMDRLRACAEKVKSGMMT